MLFALAKLTVIWGGVVVSVGTRHMSEGAANAYRVGYWLMAVGVLLTFGG